MKALIGRKLGMTQIFDDSGKMVSVTLVQAGPCQVTALRNLERDGYNAVQLGYGTPKRVNKAQKDQTVAHRREFRLAEATELEVGQTLDVSTFEVGDIITVSGISKGKGFAGTIKRHNFKRGPKTHGSDSYRAPGSIGSMYPQNIKKGKKMAGRMGHAQVTVKNLKVAQISTEDNILAVRGAVPGARKGLVIIKG